MIWTVTALASEPRPWESAPGRWYPSTAAVAERADEISQLEALGYLGAYQPAEPESGVVRWDREEAVPGVNLFSSGHASEAWLVGMDGRLLHRWSAKFEEVFPDLHTTDRRSSGAWRRVALRPSDGHLLAIWEGLGLVHLDAEGRVVWAVANRAHHEARWLPDGGVLVLTREVHPGAGPAGAPVLEDFVSQLDAAGRTVRQVSVLSALQRSAWSGLLNRIPADTGDLLHTNALSPIPITVGDGSVYRPGRVILSMRHIDAWMVLDLRDEEVVFAATGPWHRQHDVELTPSGQIQLFDNQGGSGGGSRVLVLDPLTTAPTWSWSGPPTDPLSSSVLGAAQELPGGHRLVTESTSGTALEVTPEGHVVWEYHNPSVAGPEGAWVAAIFEMVRILEPTPWSR